ncbi:hypothetical protein AVEN_100943-1, partial [Araneus ventricosus]
PHPSQDRRLGQIYIPSRYATDRSYTIYRSDSFYYRATSFLHFPSGQPRCRNRSSRLPDTARSSFPSRGMSCRLNPSTAPEDAEGVSKAGSRTETLVGGVGSLGSIHVQFGNCVKNSLLDRYI